MFNKLSLRIVLVDDDQEDRQLIRGALTQALDQILIEEMTTGQELIDWLAHQRKRIADKTFVDEVAVTVILLDMHMPALTGLETLQSLGDMADLPYMPIILLTASLSESLKQQAYQQGIHLYLLKPAGIRGFYRVVEAVKLCYRDTLQLQEQERLNYDFY